MVETRVDDARSPPQDRHEAPGILTSRILTIGAVMAVCLALVIVATWGGWYAWIARPDHTPPAVDQATLGRIVAGAPRLQPQPDHDIAAFRARVDARLDSYGWVRHQAGVAHIPIQRAMALLAARHTSGQSQPPPGSASSAQSGSRPRGAGR